jgi:hypothetical protein
MPNLSKSLSANNVNWVCALLILWTVVLCGSFAFGFFAGYSEPIPLPARMGSSAILVVAAWYWYKVARPTAVGRYSLTIAIGMTLGFVGDLFMASLIPFGDPMLGGMASFGAGHVAYILAMFYLGRTVGLTAQRTRLLAWFVWIVIGTGSWYRIVYSSDPPKTLAWPGLAYVLLLASTAGVATGLAMQSLILLPLAGGTMLFFLSDLMIAARQFGGLESKVVEATIWLTYGPAQMLIVYSSASALSLVQSNAKSLPAVSISAVSCEQS